MDAIAEMTVINHPTNMQMTARKLPPNLQNKWRDRVTNMKRVNRKMAQFQNLVNFVGECAESVNHPIYCKGVLGFKRVDNKDKKKSGENSSSFATKVEIPGERVVPGETMNSTVRISEPCPCCNQTQHLDDCGDFIKKLVEDRKSFLKERKLCFSCFGTNLQILW